MYLIDADVFIQAKNAHYGFEICPAFWEWLDGRDVLSVEKIYDELCAGKDELKDWVEGRDTAFAAPDAAVTSSLGAVATWAHDTDYDQGAISTFLGAGDYYLVAHAHAHDLTVVTHERASISKKKIKIPDVCAGVEVACINPFEMLRIEQARFVLD